MINQERALDLISAKEDIEPLPRSQVFKLLQESSLKAEEVFNNFIV